METFEYLIEANHKSMFRISLKEDLDNKGKEGWELVSLGCLPTTSNEPLIQYIFKRKASPEYDKLKTILKKIDAYWESGNFSRDATLWNEIKEAIK